MFFITVRGMVKILVVDDAYFVRLSVRSFLERQGYEVFEGENGKQALTIYDEIKPDVVFCDITMPEVSGLDFLKIIMQSHPDAKVIMLTSARDESILAEAMSLGARDVLLKPFDESKVLDVLRKVLG